MYACGDSDSEEESFDYSVAIMSPNATDKMVGDSIHLHINFDEADTKTIHNISVVLTNTEDGSEVYSVSEHVHNESGHYEHHADVVLDVEPNTSLILKASVWGMHSSDSEEEHEHEHEEVNDTDKVSEELSFIVR